MSIQLPSPRLKTPSDYLHSLTLSPPSPFARAPTPAPTFPSASNRCGANQTAQSVQLQDYQLGCGRGSKMDGIRDAPASPAPPIVLNSPPLSPKSVPAPPPRSTSTSSPTYVLSRGYDSETKYEVDGRDRDEDEDDPLLSLATFRFPGSYITPPPAGTSSAARMAEEEQQSQDDDETLSVDDVSPTFVFRFPGSYDSPSKAADNEFNLDGDAAVGVHGDIDRRKREIGVSSQLKADIPASSPYSIRTASSGGATSLAENGPQAQARLRKDQNAHPHRYLTPIEAKQLATYLTQQFSLKPKPKARTRTISISSIPIPTINMNMNNNAQKKQKGMMERSIECAEALHDAGIRWDRSRRVMGMHLRGIWEAAGGRSDLHLYVQGSFLTIAEEPHPLDDAPIPIPMDPPTYAPLPKLSIQAGLFSALPVSRDPSPLPIPTSRPVSRAIPLSFGATSNPNSASFSASDTSLSPYHAASSGQNLDVDVEMKDRSRRRSFNGLGFSFRSTSRSMSKSHGSRASISSFISIAASACAPRSGLEPAASANGLAPEPAPACSSIETSTSAIHIDESFGLDGRMEINYQSRRGSRSNSRVGSAVPALAPDPAQAQADDVQSSLRAFRFPSTDAGGAQVQGKGRSKNGEITQSQNVIHSQKNGDNPQNHSHKKWNERKMDVTLKIKIDGHQTSIHGRGGPQHHQHHHRHSHTAGLTSFSALSTSFPHPQQPYTAVPAHHGKQYSHAGAVPYVYTPCTAASHSRTFHPRTPLTAVHGNMGNRWTSSNRQGGLGRGRYWSKLSRSLYIDFKVGKKRFRIRSDRSRNCHCAHEAYALASSGGVGTEGWAVTPGLKSGVGGGGRGKGRRRPRSVRRVSFGGYEVR